MILSARQSTLWQRRQNSAYSPSETDFLLRFGFFQRRKVFHEIDEVLGGHGELEADGHERGGEFLAFGDFGIFNFGDYAILRFDGEFVCGFGSENTEEFVAGFCFDAPGFEAEGDAAAGVEDGLVE